jgi:hypothetical protein
MSAHFYTLMPMHMTHTDQKFIRSISDYILLLFVVVFVQKD